MEIVLKTSLTLDVEPLEGKHWIVIGAGGNGGYYIPNLVRAIAIANVKLDLAGRRKHQVTIIDADDVEEKNLVRQNFLRSDIGKKKATVLAERYGRAFGVEVNYIDGYMNSAQMLRDIARNGNVNIPVVVGAVDNNKTRAIIYSVFRDFPGMYWLDAGNEEWGGQVVLGYNAGYSASMLNPKNAGAKQKFDLPSVAHLYPEILLPTDKLPDELSCAERAISNPQNIFTNQTAANLMLGFTNIILNADALSQAGLKYHSVAFNSQTSSFTTRLNYIENLVMKESVVATVEPEVKVKPVKKAIATAATALAN